MLDTGSGMSVISEETAKRLGIKLVARGGLARAVGGGGKFEIVYGFVIRSRLAARGSKTCRSTFASFSIIRSRLMVILGCQ